MESVLGSGCGRVLEVFGCGVPLTTGSETQPAPLRGGPGEDSLAQGQEVLPNYFNKVCNLSIYNKMG